MKTRSTLLAALAAVLLITTSCRKHDDTPVVTYAIPTTYDFTNANFADATTRLGMVTEMQNIEKLATTGGVVDGVKLKNMLTNTSAPFVTAAYNTAGIQLKDQLAPLFQTDVVSFIDSLVKVNTATTTASRGIPGVGTSTASASTKYAETGLGVNYAQVFTKGFVGGLVTYQEVAIMTNILNGTYDNTLVVNGSTAREHAWDMAFGYWGVPIDFPTNKTGVKLWGSYTTQVDSGYKANKILMTAFCTGRAAISAKDNATAIAQANIIINVFERLQGAAALQEVQEIKASLSDNIVRNSRLSECYGFIYGEKYNPKRNVTDAQINTFLALFPKNFYDLTLTDVNNIRDAVAAQFGFNDVKDISCSILKSLNENRPSGPLHGWFYLNTMRKLIYVALAAVFAFVVIESCSKSSGGGDTTTVSASFDRKGMLTNLATNIIIPAYTSYQSATVTLDAAVTAFNATPNATTLTALQTAFVATYKQWQSTSEFEFGPAAAIQFRDNTNTFPTDVTQITGNINSGVYVPGALANLSAKGLPALDYLLYSPDNATVLTLFTTDSKAANRKTYLAALSAELKTNAATVLSGWTNYKATFINADGTDASSSTALFVNQFVFDYEKLKNNEIGIPAGVQTLGSTLPAKVQGYYSKISVQLATLHTTAFQNLYLGKSAAGDGLGLDDYLIAVNAKNADGTSLNDAIKSQFTTSLSKLATLSDPLSTNITNNNTLVTAAYTELQKLTVLLKTNMTAAIKVAISFGDTDGD